MNLNFLEIIGLCSLICSAVTIIWFIILYHKDRKHLAQESTTANELICVSELLNGIEIKLEGKAPIILDSAEIEAYRKKWINHWFWHRSDMPFTTFVVNSLINENKEVNGG